MPGRILHCHPPLIPRVLHRLFNLVQSPIAMICELAFSTFPIFIDVSTGNSSWIMIHGGIGHFAQKHSCCPAVYVCGKEVDPFGWDGPRVRTGYAAGGRGEARRGEVCTWEWAWTCLVGRTRQHRQAGREKTREEWKQGLSVLSCPV